MMYIWLKHIQIKLQMNKKQLLKNLWLHYHYLMMVYNLLYLKKNFDNLDVRILHYNGSIKPWNKEDFICLREIYSNYYLKVFNRPLIFKEITRFERTKSNIRKIVDYIKFKFLEV